MATNVKYVPVDPARDASELLRALHRGDRALLCQAIVDVAHATTIDERWVLEALLALSRHGDADVANAAIISIGHLARVRRRIDRRRVLPVLRRFLRDASRAVTARHALSDVAIFAPSTRRDRSCGAVPPRVQP